MFDEAFVDCFVVVGAESLFEEGEQDGDDDACFEAFAEADEEDWFLVSLVQLVSRHLEHSLVWRGLFTWHGKYIGSHDM